MIIPIGQYKKIKRRNCRNKIYYKCTYFWDSEMLKSLKKLKGDSKSELVY